MPILRSLEILGRQERRPGFRATLEAIADTIRSGGSLSDGLILHPRTFDRLFVNLTRAGETGGVLATVLERLAIFQEKMLRIRGRIFVAMAYPLVISLVSAGIMGVLLMWVVPAFQATFFNLLPGRPLPWLTQLVTGIAAGLRQYFWRILPAVAVLAVLAWLFCRSAFGRQFADRALLSVPVLGDLCLKSSIAQFARTFGTLLASGVPILTALVICRETCRYAGVAEAIGQVHDRVKAGETVARPLGASGIFPALVAGMVEVGEETGALPDMLACIADAYDEEVDRAVAAMTAMLEPLMIVVMAFAVGTIVIAMFLPMVELIRGLSR